MKKNITNLKTSNNCKEKYNNRQNAMATVLIVGHSIINSILVEGLCGGGPNVKVRNFPGATVDDLNHYIIPLV